MCRTPQRAGSTNATGFDLSTKSDWPACYERESGRPAFHGVLRTTHQVEIVAVPGGGEAFARRVRAGSVASGRDTKLRLLDDVPVLSVRAVPEFDGVLDITARKGRRMKQPFR